MRLPPIGRWWTSQSLTRFLSAYPAGIRWQLFFWSVAHVLGSLIHGYGLYADRFYINPESRDAAFALRISWFILTIALGILPFYVLSAFTRVRGLFLLGSVLSQSALLIYLERASSQPVYYEGLIDLFILLIVIEVDTFTLFLAYVLPALLYRALAGPEAFLEARNLIYLVGPICFAINRFKAIASRLLDREKEMEAMRRMVQAMAHQMKTPWAYVQQLASGVEFAAAKPGSSPDYFKQQANEIIETARIATEGTDMFLMNASEVVSRTLFETIDAVSLIQNCLSDSFVVKLHPELKITFHAYQNFQVKVSRGLFRNIVNNLLQNAATSIRHAGKGEITITTKNDARDGFQIEFLDTGLGLDPELRRRIFNRGYSDFRNGTGYGLPFCADAMHLFGGHIDAYGEPGNFAIFKLNFPVKI